MPIDCGTVIITDELIKQVEQHKKEQNMSVKDFKEEIIKNNQLVIRWDFESDQHETKYKVWVGDEHMKMFVISSELTKEKHDLEEFLNKKYAEHKKYQEMIKDFKGTLKDLKNMLSEGLVIKEIIRKNNENFFNYDLLLSDNLTRFMFNIKRNHIKKHDKLEAVIAERHKPSKKEDEEYNILVKDLTNILSEGFRIWKFEIEKDKNPMVYQVVLTDMGETTYTFHVDPNDSEKESQLEEIINKYYEYTPPICNLTNGDFVEPQKDAPFYQNMTKTEVVESLVRCIYRGESTAEHFLTKNNVFLYDDIVVIEGLIEGKNKGYQQFCKYNKEGKFWTIEDSNNPKELAPLASEERQHQKHLMEREAQRKKEESKMKAKAQFKEPELTTQDLIQAAKDELVDRIIKGSSAAHNEGFAYCINFLEQTMGKDPYKN